MKRDARASLAHARAHARRRSRRLAASATLVLLTASALSGVCAVGFTAPAAALDLGRITVPAGYQHGKVLVLRPDRIDVAVDGRVLRAVRHAGSLDLASLPALIGDPSYVRALRAGSIRLEVPLLGRPGTSLAGTAPSLSRLELGARGQILATHAGLTLTAVTVSAAPGRTGGFLRFVNGASVSLVRSRILGLGATRTARTGAVAAVQVSNSAARLTATTIAGGGPGLLLHRPTDVRLDGVTVSGTGGDGVVVEAPVAASVRGVSVTGSRGTGLRIVGPWPARTLDGPITVASNQQDGVLLQSVTGLTLSGVTTAANGGIGVHLRGTSQITVRRSTSTGDAVGVGIESSQQLRLEAFEASKDGRGVSVKGSRDLTISGLVVTDSRLDGVNLSARDVTVGSSTIRGAQEGLVVEAGSQAVTIDETAVSGSRNALRVAADTSAVALTRVTLDAPTGVALRVAGAGTSLQQSTLTGATGIVTRGAGTPLAVTGTDVTASGVALALGRGTGDTTVEGGQLTGRGVAGVAADGGSLALTGVRVEGGRTGIDTHGALSATRTTVSGGQIGVRAADTRAVTLTGSSVSAAAIGVSAGTTAHVTLDETDVSAPNPSQGQVTFRGHNRWSHLPLRWLGLAALIAVCGAVLLEIVRKFRDRSLAVHGQAPEHVLNHR